MVQSDADHTALQLHSQQGCEYSSIGVVISPNDS